MLILSFQPRTKSLCSKWQTSLLRQGTSVHTYSISPIIFKGKNKLKEDALPGSHCSALGIEVDRRGRFIPSMTNPQPAKSQDANRTQRGTFGGCPSSNVTHPEALNFSDSNFLSAKWRRTISSVSCEKEDLLVREKYPCPQLPQEEELPHTVCYQARVLRNCSAPGSGPRHSLTGADKPCG